MAPRLNDGSSDPVMQRVRLELFRDNLSGALDLLESARQSSSNPAYDAEMARIRSWLAPLARRDTYAATYERYYRRVKYSSWLKVVERRLRTLMGRKTRRLVERHARHSEFMRLEREVRRVNAHRVLDAGCGEGRSAITLAARNPGVRVEGIEVSATNVAIARRINRFPNAKFHQGLIEDAGRIFGLEQFDVVWAFSVLEHVWDLDASLAALLAVLRPDGRLCISVPMNELRATGPLPEFDPDDEACHIRAFSEESLRARFARFPDFTLEKLPGLWRPWRYPATIAPVEFGAYFVVVAKPSP